MGWVSIRNGWPQAPGKYRVLDIRKETETNARYDGYEFIQPEIFFGENQSSKRFVITHWKHEKDKRFDKMAESLERQRKEIGEL